MSDWVRPLFQSAGSPATWHIARDKDFATTTFCGETIDGPLEVAHDEEKTHIDGRCELCPRVEAERREHSVLGAGRR